MLTYLNACVGSCSSCFWRLVEAHNDCIKMEPPVHELGEHEVERVSLCFTGNLRISKNPPKARVGQKNGKISSDLAQQ